MKIASFYPGDQGTKSLEAIVVDREVVGIRLRFPEFEFHSGDTFSNSDFDATLSLLFHLVSYNYYLLVFNCVATMHLSTTNLLLLADNQSERHGHGVFSDKSRCLSFTTSPSLAE